MAATAPISLNLAHMVHALLTRPRGLRVDRLLADLNIAPRTYRKYRELLRDHFAPFRRDDGTSRVEEVREGEARYLRLVDLAETSVQRRDFAGRVAAVHLARQLFGFLADTDIGEALGDLVTEFAHRLSDSAFVIGHLLRNVDRMFYDVPWAPKDYSTQRRTLRTVLHALLFSRHLEIDYDSASAGLRTMSVEPLSLVTHRGGLYLLASHVDFDDIRTFAIDRMRSARLQKQRFDYPPRTAFDPEDYTEGCFGIFREPDGKPVEVELIFADKRWLKLDLMERRWHPTQELRELDDGRLWMRFTVGSMVEVWPWIRSFGDDVEVVQPV